VNSLHLTLIYTVWMVDQCTDDMDAHLICRRKVSTHSRKRVTYLSLCPVLAGCNRVMRMVKHEKAGDYRGDECVDYDLRKSIRETQFIVFISRILL
jgi:hypothetical protein